MSENVDRRDHAEILAAAIAERMSDSHQHLEAAVITALLRYIADLVEAVALRLDAYDRGGTDL